MEVLAAYIMTWGLVVGATGMAYFLKPEWRDELRPVLLVMTAGLLGALIYRKAALKPHTQETTRADTNSPAESDEPFDRGRFDSIEIVPPAPDIMEPDDDHVPTHYPPADSDVHELVRAYQRRADLEQDSEAESGDLEETRPGQPATDEGEGFHSVR